MMIKIHKTGKGYNSETDYKTEKRKDRNYQK